MTERLTHKPKVSYYTSLSRLFCCLFTLQLVGYESSFAKDKTTLAVSSKAQDTAAVPHPFFWDIKGPNGEIGHLMGTVHIPDERWERFPADLLADLDRSNAVYGELDLTEKNALNAGLMKIALLKNGDTLQKIIGDRLYNKLDHYLKTKGQAAAFFNGFHPKLVEVTIGLLDVMPLLMSGKPVLDEWILRRAKSKGIKTGGVETPKEQTDALFYGTLEDAKTSLEFTIDLLSKKTAQGIKPFEALFKAYLTGDEDQILNTIKSDLKDAPQVQIKAMHQLLNVRNYRMAERIVKKFKESPKQRLFFAFGVAHFVGPEGVSQLLRKKGFTVQRRYAPKSKTE